MPDKNYQNSVLVEPTEGPITWRGESITAGKIVDVFTRNWERAAWRTANVVQARDFRRKELRVKIAQSWRDKFPEVAAWAVSTLAERQTIEREQIARVNAVQATFNREALDEKKLSDDEAGECERYMNEWRTQKTDQQELGIKGVEDGEWGYTILPAKDDISGRPDFYDRVTEDALTALSPSERAAYRKDETDRRGRYARVDERGNKVPHAKWDRSRDGKTRAQAGESFTRDEARSQQAHEAALDQYLLQHEASSVRLIPALDCVPIYGRGTGKDRYVVTALIERSLISVEEAIEAGYGWTGMGNRHTIPRGYSPNRRTGQNGDYYLYSLYCTSTDAKGIEHPLILYCLGGYGTSYQNAAAGPSNKAKDAVGFIDLYKTHGLTGRFWGYFGGMHTGDDEPYYRYQPWMFPFIEQMLSIEGTTTSIKSVIGSGAYTGFNYKPDAKLGELDDQAILEQGPNGKTLRKPVFAKPGEIVTNAGDITPQQPAIVSPDAWRLNASEVQALQQNTSTTRPNDASGNAIAISETLAMVNQAQVRGGVRDAIIFAGECHLKILDAAYERWGIRWPLNTTMKRASGTETTSRGSTKVARFDPAWLGDGEVKNYKLSADYPQEENLARVDLTRSLKADGLASFADVQKDRGVENPDDVRLEILKDRLWDDPSNQLLYQQRVAQIVGNRRMQQILKLKAAQLMTGGADKGLPEGIPTKMVQSGGQQGGGGASSVTAQRAGIQGGQLGTATAQQELTSNMGVGAQPGVAA